jgi:hypothetical protein
MSTLIMMRYTENVQMGKWANGQTDGQMGKLKLTGNSLAFFAASEG